MSKPILKFENNQIFEINGFSKKDFIGEYSELQLAEILANEWIIDCLDCGKHKYCRYGVSNFKNTSNSESYRCNFAVVSLKNFIINTSHAIVDSSNKIKQKYLDSAYYFTTYLLKSEQLNSILVDNEKFKHYGWDTKAYSGLIIPIRDVLNKLSENLKCIPDLFMQTSILLVEGESEMTFINSTRGINNVYRMEHFNVECYKGGGNKKLARIEMLLDKYKDIGYSIYFQGDRDGKENQTGYESFFQYVESGYLKKENIFQFKFDFETALPKQLLYNILIKFDELNNITFEEFDEKTNDKSVNNNLLKEFNINTKTKSLKKRIAHEAGKAFLFLNPLDREQFMKSELGQFVDFLKRIQ
ncbi:MAG: hypothetical protein HQ541_08025 [Mariniphaga sp.]|nr:hypothetical protein [Mariniphaga sp.]